MRAGACALPREIHQRLVGAEPFRTVDVSLGLELGVRSIASQNPGLPAIAQADVQDLPELPSPAFREHGSHHLDALGEIAEHPVGGADEELTLEWVSGARGEVEDPGVLEEPADDRARANVLRQPRYPW